MLSLTISGIPALSDYNEHEEENPVSPRCATGIWRWHMSLVTVSSANLHLILTTLAMWNCFELRNLLLGSLKLTLSRRM